MGPNGAYGGRGKKQIIKMGPMGPMGGGANKIMQLQIPTFLFACFPLQSGLDGRQGGSHIEFVNCVFVTQEFLVA